MVEIIQRIRQRDGSEVYELFVNNVLLPQVDIDGSPPELSITVKDYEITKRLISCTFSDVFKDVVALVLNTKTPWHGQVYDIYIYRRDKTNRFDILFSIEIDVTKWKQLWSLSEYIEAFSEVVNASQVPEISFSQADGIEGYGFDVTFDLLDPQFNIIAEIDRCANRLNDLKEQAENLLTSRLNNDSIIFFFAFPEAVRIPCEQYLLYFTEFLRDLGIEATAELQHEASQVLFAVKPSDAHEALDKIRVALEIYMRLPSSSINDFSTLDNEIAVQRLAANIYHLKGQLALVHAALQSSERAIQQQQDIIEAQQRLISGEIILRSAKKVTNQTVDNDKEELLKGALTITKFKGKGFEINLPEVYRRLKRFLNPKQ